MYVFTFNICILSILFHTNKFLSPCCYKHLIFPTGNNKSSSAHHLVTTNTQFLNTTSIKRQNWPPWLCTKKESHSVCQPCLWVFTSEPNCVWHLFQTDLFGPGGISGWEVNRGKMRSKDVRRVVMGKPMIDIPISHLTRWGQGSDNELWHINELV